MESTRTLYDFCNFDVQRNLQKMFNKAFAIIQTTYILLLFTGIYTPLAYAQSDPETKAIRSFEDGNYNDALPVFTDLVRLYPDDPRLNYYLGASLIETGQLSGEAAKAIKIAVQGECPKKLDYYLGLILHSHNEWDKALSNYEKFASKAKKKELKSTDLEKLMNQCRNRINPFQNTSEAIEEKEPDIQNIESAKVVETKDTITHPEKISITIPEGLEDSILNFQINSEVKYLYIKHFRNEESKQFFIEGWIKDQKLKEIRKKTEQLRNSYQSATESKKLEIASQILAAEKQIFQLSNEIPELYASARNIETRFWDEAGEDQLSNFKNEIKHLSDSIEWQRVNQKKKLDKLIEPDTLVINSVQMENTEEITPEEEITFRIQIGAYRGKLPDWVNRLYQKLSIIRKIENYTDDNGVTVYTTGRLNDYNEAVMMLKQVQQEGVKDAIIAAYKNGTRIPMGEARKLIEQK